MNRKILLSILTIFVFMFAIQIAGPISAAKVIDKGVWYAQDTEAGGPGKYTWKTYKYSSTYIKVIEKMYKKVGYKKYRLVETSWVKLKKIKKNKLKIIYSYDPRLDSQYRYVHTKKTTTQYYWKVFKPRYLG